VVIPIKQAIKHTDGMLLVAAPPGRGRTASLYAMLRHIHEPGLNAMTVEETISFSMPEAVQAQATPSMGFSYTDMLRACLGLDPDIILAEDLGRPENTSLGIDAVRKGIMVLGGIHAGDGVAAISKIAAL
jgi:type II secretory ATPase GspE/PulE/Tfp pilus assembly ATPase PilB-like protein